MTLDRRIVPFALVLGVLMLAAAFLVSTSVARADEIEAVAAGDVVAELRLADDERPPGEPKPRECVQACEERARLWVRQCVADRGTKERCEKQGEKKARECIERCPPEARDPKPPPRVPEPRKPDLKRCVGHCERLAREYYGACMRRTDGEKPAECKRKAARFLEACIDRKCPREAREPDPGRVDPRPEPPKPSPERCEEACEKTAREFLRKCEAGRPGVEPEDCATRARKLYRACVDKCPPKADPRPDPDEPKTCEERCKLLGRQTLAECKTQGGTPERCENRAIQVTRQCIADRCP